MYKRKQFPEEIQCKITYDFLNTFKCELDRIFKKELNNLQHDKPTYWNFYQWCDLKGGWIKALKVTCEFYEFNSLYKYIKNLKYPDSDIMQCRLTELLYEYGIIQCGEPKDAMPCPFY